MSEFEPPPQNGTITMTHNGVMHHFFPSGITPWTKVDA